MTDVKLVRDFMTMEVVTLDRNDSLTLADDIMKLGRIRHLPVLDAADESVVGIVSQRDLFRGALARCLGYGEHAQRVLMDQLVVKEVMVTDVATTEPDVPLEAAAKTMLARKIGCLVVVERNRLVGILTESDFVKAFAGLR